MNKFILGFVLFVVPGSLIAFGLYKLAKVLKQKSDKNNKRRKRK